jgi:hypothetical protein
VPCDPYCSPALITCANNDMCEKKRIHVHRGPRLRVAVCQPVPLGSSTPCIHCGMPNLSNHVGAIRGSCETLPAGSGEVSETVSRPPALPTILESSTLVQPFAYIPSRTWPPPSACGLDSLGRFGPSHLVCLLNGQQLGCFQHLHLTPPSWYSWHESSVSLHCLV